MAEKNYHLILLMTDFFKLVVIFIAGTLSILDIGAQEHKDSVATPLDEVVVTEKRDFLHNTKMGLHSFSGSEILRIPVIFGEPDIVKAFHTLPGVSVGMEGFSGLYVRGGENDQNQFLMDGLPLHNVSHLGGVFSVFNARSIRKADFYKSAFPASMGGKVSSITDMHLHRPDFRKTLGSVSIGLISGSAYLTFPLRKDRTALSLSLRRTWLDVVTAPALAIMNAAEKGNGKKTLGGYYFMDGSLRLDHIPRPDITASLTAFFSHDSFRIGEKIFSTDDYALVNDYEKTDITRLKWSSYGAVASVRKLSGRNLFILKLHWTGAHSQQGEEVGFLQDSEIEESYTSNSNSIEELGVSQKWEREITDCVDFNLGASQNLRMYHPEQREMVRVGSDEETLQSKSRQIRTNAGELAAYGEVNWNPNMPFCMTAGLRLQTYLCKSKTDIVMEPRLSMRFSLSESASLKAGYSRMSQFMQQVSSNYIALPSDSWLPTGAVHKPLVSDIFSFGTYALICDRLRVSAEIWYKTMDGLAEFREGVSIANPSIHWKEKVTFGTGRAYGIDISLSREFRNVFINLSYGLMWNHRKFNTLNNGKSFPAKFDNRHKIDVSSGWKIKKNMTLSAQWQYMSGNRTTLALYNVDVPEQFYPRAPTPLPQRPSDDDYIGADYYTGRNNVRLPAFHRLNLNLSIEGNLKGGKSYTWNFGLYNAYWHKNAFTIKKDNILYGDYDGIGWNRNFKVLSLIPVLPSVSYTINF